MADQELDDIARQVWKKWGRTPGELFGSLTPSQFYTLFTTPPGSNSVDRVEAIARLNRERGKKGLRPVVPSWM